MFQPDLGSRLLCVLDSENQSADEAFAVNLRQAREDAGLSQEAVAQEMRERGFRFHQTTVNKIETGERKVPVGEATELAAVLGIPLDTMLQSSDTRVFRAQMINRSVDKIRRLAKAVEGPLDEIGAELENVDVAADQIRGMTTHLLSDAKAANFEKNLDVLAAFSKWSTPKKLAGELGLLREKGIVEFVGLIMGSPAAGDTAASLGFESIPADRLERENWTFGGEMTDEAFAEFERRIWEDDRAPGRPVKRKLPPPQAPRRKVR